jgi:hypothetical protein
MPRKSIAAALAAVARAIIAPAWAHSDGEEAARPQGLDCEHLPEKALAGLPAAFDTWAKLHCLPTAPDCRSEYSFLVLSRGN